MNPSAINPFRILATTTRVYNIRTISTISFRCSGSRWAILDEGELFNRGTNEAIETASGVHAG